MKIVINGIDRDIDERLTCTWSNVCSLARHGHKGSDAGKTVTWRNPAGLSGELAPLDLPIAWVEGTIFNVASESTILGRGVLAKPVDERASETDRRAKARQT